MKIFTLYSQGSPVICTRSESKVFTLFSKYYDVNALDDVYIVEAELDTMPCKEIIWDSLDEFEQEYLTA